MNDQTKATLIELAQKYETAGFLKKDPSQFMHRYNSVQDKEIVAFISANLAFGRREQILLHIEQILDRSGSSPAQWILDKKYESFFPESAASFYRMYTFSSMRLFFDTIRQILNESETLGAHMQKLYETARNGNAKYAAAFSGSPLLAPLISSLFPTECNLIPHTAESASKKLNMFLRWMVRDNSPVDLGLWDWYPKQDLLMPLDTHVMQEATNLELIPPAQSGKPRAASLKTAVQLTECLRQVFPDDPVRADFALFGLGADKSGS